MNENLSHINQVTSHDYSDNPKAGFGIRFVAIVIDALVVQLVHSLLVGFFVRKGAGSDVKILLQTLFVYWVVYFLICCLPLYNSGQTLGKKLMKIRVIPAEGESHLRMGQVIIREIGVKGFLTAFSFGIGYLWYFVGNKGKTWQDLIAKTKVISLKT